MAVLNYVTQFYTRILSFYEQNLKSNALFMSNSDIKIVGARDIRIPRLTVSGYKDHTRGGAFNVGSYSNDFETKTLDHDRDIEFGIDPMDVDETNQIVSIANVQRRFEIKQAIPELDCYTFSKIFAEATRVGSKIATTAITTSNVLSDFDANCEAFKNAGVPLSRCILYCTPAFNTLIKNADGISRTITVTSTNRIDRRVATLDDLGSIVEVPSERFMTAYDFTDGFASDATGVQINYILIDPESQVSRTKYSYINVYTPGHDSRTADNYMYQNRRYNGSFGLDQELEVACVINTAAA